MGNRMVFQSLGRDSVCSSEWPEYEAESVGQVSISWARFCLFKPVRRPFSKLQLLGFNLLGEILSVQAIIEYIPTFLTAEFQSLGRDSVCSSFLPVSQPRYPILVSISWARFCLFKRAGRGGGAVAG